jgi:type IV pilus assembly protein PilB
VLRQKDFVVAMLLEQGLLTPDGVEQATRNASEKRVSVTEAAVALGLVTSRQVAIARATVCECPFVDLTAYELDLRNAAMMPRSVAEKQLAFPLFNLGRSVTVGMADPLDLKSVDRVRSLLRTDLEVVLCDPEPLRALIDRAYSLTGGRGSAEAEAAVETEGAGAAEVEEPIVAAVNQILIQAMEQNASDVHISPDERELHLRYRIDGSLQARQGPGLASHPGLVQRLKVMSNLDLTQTRRPQDGKFRFSHHSRAVDVRVSIIPTVCGENVVLRLLASGTALSSFKELGFAPDLAKRMEEVIERPHGMVLVTGPTGSGKTTTLYTFLRKLNTPDRNLVTIEDPVEIRLPMVRQVQVNTEVGMTFASALRSILRQDPDVILVGEIRDEETARIAVQSALTGHLVLTTLHTNDAPGAVARLRDFNCPSFAINAAVLCVLAQRLVKRVCPECAKPCVPDPLLLRRFAHHPEASQFRRGSGCQRCLSSGFRGRVGVYEFLDMGRPIQERIEEGASTATIRSEAIRRGMRPLWEDGFEKARLGLTTLEEVVRIAAGTIEPDTAACELPAPGHTEMRMSA